MFAFVEITLVVSCWTIVVHSIEPPSVNAANTDRTTTFNAFMRDIYATLTYSIRSNSQKLKLDDFSLGIFSGTKGHLNGIQHFELVNDNTLVHAENRLLNASFEFTVPELRATWEKSACMGNSYSMTIELRDAVFALQFLLNAEKCEIDHLAYLKTYANAKCYAIHGPLWPISAGVITATTNILSRMLNTEPLHKVIIDNVNYALLQLPIFDRNDIRRWCENYPRGL